MTDKQRRFSEIGCGEIGTLTRHVSGDEDGDTIGYEFNLGNGRHVWCGELSKTSFSELDTYQQEALGNDFGWFIVLYERDGRHVLGKAIDEWAAERLVSIIGPALSLPTDASGPGSASNTESSPVNRGKSSPTPTVAVPGPTAGDVEQAYRIGKVAGAATARAELLAQIREPSEELFGPLKDKYWQFVREELAEFMRALADKLTEAK